MHKMNMTGSTARLVSIASARRASARAGPLLRAAAATSAAVAVPSDAGLRRFRITDSFSAHVPRLREAFELSVGTPLGGNFGERTRWDFWHVDGQYHSLRTPAEAFFTDMLLESAEDNDASKEAYLLLDEDLREFGRRELGCHDMTMTWMSNYVDRCFQNFHVDSTASAGFRVGFELNTGVGGEEGRRDADSTR